MQELAEVSRRSARHQSGFNVRPPLGRGAAPNVKKLARPEFDPSRVGPYDEAEPQLSAGLQDRGQWHESLGGYGHANQPEQETYAEAPERQDEAALQALYSPAAHRLTEHENVGSERPRSISDLEMLAVMAIVRCW